jgi:hypothetical protein
MVSPVGISGIEGLGAELEIVEVAVCVGEVLTESVGANVGSSVGGTVVGGRGVAVDGGGCSSVSVFTKKTS